MDEIQNHKDDKTIIIANKLWIAYVVNSNIKLNFGMIKLLRVGTSRSSFVASLIFFGSNLLGQSLIESWQHSRPWKVTVVATRLVELALTFLPSLQLVSMTIISTLCSHIIRQKSGTFIFAGPTIIQTRIDVKIYPQCNSISFLEVFASAIT